MVARFDKLANETYLRFEAPQNVSFFSAVGKEEGYFPSISITVPLSSPVEHDEKRE